MGKFYKVLLGISTVLVFAGIGSASAYANTYYSGSTTLIAGETRFVRKAGVKAKAYFKNAKGNKITITDINYCPFSSHDYRQNQDRHALAKTDLGSGTVITNFRFDRQDADGTLTKLKIESGKYTPTVGTGKDQKACKDGGSLTYSVPEFTKDQRDPSTGMFVIAITATHKKQYSDKATRPTYKDKDGETQKWASHDGWGKTCNDTGCGWDGIQNGFRLSTDDGTIIHAAGDGHEVTLEQTKTPKQYYDYIMKFGSSCEVTSPKKASIKFYDLDNLQTDVQPKTMKIKLRAAPKGANKWDEDPVSITIPNGKKTKDGWWKPASSQNANTTITFTAQPGKRYELLMYNVYGNNTVQFGLPYDGIYYDPGCMEWELGATSKVKVYDGGTPINNVTKTWSNYSSLPATYTDANIAKASTGQDVYFIHQVKNVGESASSARQPAVQTFYRKTLAQINAYKAGDTGGSGISGWNPKGYLLASKSFAKGASRTYHTKNGGLNEDRLMKVATDPTSNQNYLCQRIAAPYRAGDTSLRFSRPACVKLQTTPPNYNLVPSVDSVDPAHISAGGTVDVKASIKNDGTTDRESGSFGGLIRVVIPASSSFTPPTTASTKTSAIEGKTTNGTAWACDLAEKIFGAGNLKSLGANRCKLLVYTAKFRVGLNSDNIAKLEQTIGSNLVEPGDKVCYFAAVSKYSHANSVTNKDNRISGVVCTTVSKSPLVQITGGDVMVRSTNGKIITGSADIGSNRYGSWIEYAAFAPNRINTYTAGVLKNGGSTTAVQTGLTFANTGSQPGHYGTLSAAPNVMNNFTEANGWTEKSSSGDWTASPSSNLQTGYHYKRTSGTVTINAMNGFTKSVVIEAPTIIIKGNITYSPGSYTNIGSLPQLVLKATTIQIDSGVTNVDAWLLADTVSTCGAVPTPHYYSGLTTKTCDKQLTVNGPIQTKHLYLRRTAGADGNDKASLSRPAEKLNLRADAYLWLQARALMSGGGATNSQAIRTEYTRELSPRY
ncbi:MAG TPA: hypothetical protein PKD19_02595 [Candidatus Saccharibacteria bacterium]|nr:hypothetical protein [Candidatus Saccharibacteria bacterium]HMR38524.1 hypothetical protein [Candidatus Saccharibacteria bacterium]